MPTTTYKWEIMGFEKDKNSGTVEANSEAHAKRLARKATGITWGKKWKRGWNFYANNNGDAAWIGDNDYEPWNILWVYIPKEQ